MSCGRGVSYLIRIHSFFSLRGLFKNLSTSKKIVKGYKLLNIFTKRSILDAWYGSKYASVLS